MTLNLTPTRKDKPLLGFLKESATVGRTTRRLTREPKATEVPGPLFKTTRSHSSETSTR